MAVPDYQSLMLPVLLASAGDEVRTSDVVDHLAEQLSLTPEERAERLPSGNQKLFYNRVHWAKFYLGKAGLIEGRRRGHFKITERGHQVIASHPDHIDSAFLSQFREFRQFKEKSAQDVEAGEHGGGAVLSAQTATPDETMRVAHKQIEAALGQELLDRVRAGPPAFFERLIVNLLRKMGYGGSAAEASRAIGRSGDDGVDGVIDQDALGLDRV
jgi:restriction system protein